LRIRPLAVPKCNDRALRKNPQNTRVLLVPVSSKRIFPHVAGNFLSNIFLCL